MVAAYRDVLLTVG